MTALGQSAHGFKRYRVKYSLLRHAHWFVLCCCLLASSLTSAGADDYPTRPVHWIVGYPAGGTTDILARLIGQWLADHLGQQFIIENKPGAGNNIVTEAVVISQRFKLA